MKVNVNALEDRWANDPGSASKLEISDSTRVLLERRRELDTEMKNNNLNDALKSDEYNNIKNSYETEFLGVMSPISKTVNTSGDLNSLAKKYSEMSSVIKEKYTGAELDDHIAALDEAYNRSVDGVSFRAKVALNSAFLKQQGKAAIFSGSKGGSISLKGEKAAALNEINENAAQSIKKYGESMQQYLKNGGNIDDTETLDNYISQNAGPYSRSDLDLLDSVINNWANGNSSKLAFNKKFEESGFSKTAKDALLQLSQG
jgi:hypothetical protein